MLTGIKNVNLMTTFYYNRNQSVQVNYKVMKICQINPPKKQMIISAWACLNNS